jgi:hypothetical protein
LPILETRPEHFLRVLEAGKVSTNVYLRRIHNFALDMTWLPWPVLPKKRWPAVEFKEKRGITLAEHLAIVARENNPERKAFYKLAWHLGASQSDLAFLEAENVDWDNHVISYQRMKTDTVAIMRFDEDMAEILRDLPGSGPLFPYLRTIRAGDRATEFKQRCDGLGIKGVSLHMPRASSAFQHFSVSSNVALNTVKCVCNCGSSARELSCTNEAATRLPVTRSVRLPCLRTRVAAKISSSRKAMQADSSCAVTSRSSSNVTASTDTDLGGAQVKSKNTRRWSAFNCRCVRRSSFCGFRFSHSA